MMQMLMQLFALIQYFEFVFYIPVIGALINLLLSFCGSLSRGFVGYKAANGLEHCNRPKKTLILYQYEGCPFCRLVRENFSVLALDVIVYPCPRTTLARYGVSDESRFRPEAARLSGKCMFPLLVDPNFETPVVMLESRDIISHVWKHYGNKATPPWNFRCVSNFRMTCFLPSAFRFFPWMGIIRTPSKEPGKKLIELYAYDACPYSRLVREALDSLELPYLLHNQPIYGAMPAQSEIFQALLRDANSSSFLSKLSCISTPLLIDPNTGSMIANSADCVAYLTKTYAIGRATCDWSQYSTKGASACHGTIPGYLKDGEPAGGEVKKSQ